MHCIPTRAGSIGGAARCSNIRQQFGAERTQLSTKHLFMTRNGDRSTGQHLKARIGDIAPQPHGISTCVAPSAKLVRAARMGLTGRRR